MTFFTPEYRLDLENAERGKQCSGEVVEKIRESFIECAHCSTEFRCPFHIGDTKTFSHAILWGARVRCPCCDVTSDCNERNMSYVLEDDPAKHYRSRANGGGYAVHPEALYSSAECA